MVRHHTSVLTTFFYTSDVLAFGNEEFRVLSRGLPPSQVPTILSPHIITKFDTTSLNKHHRLSATHTRTHARRSLESVTWTVLDVQASADSFWRTGLHYSSWTCSSRSRGYKARGRKKKEMQVTAYITLSIGDRALLYILCYSYCAFPYFQYRTTKCTE